MVIGGILDNNIVLWEPEPVSKTKFSKVLCRAGEIYREFVITGVLNQVNTYHRYLELPNKLSRFYMKVSDTFEKNRAKHAAE